MIIYFNKKINSFLKFNIKNFTLTQEYIQELMPTCEDITCNCPNCNAHSNFSLHGAYTRNISFLIESKIYNFRVSVTRVRCNSCKSTHALLPNFIVPYKNFSFESILNIVTEACSSSVLKTAEKLQLSYQLIYSFINLLLLFFNYIDSLNREKELYSNFNKSFYLKNCLKICNINFKIIFFNRYKWIFLMTKCRNKLSPPFTIELNLIIST